MEEIALMMNWAKIAFTKGIMHLMNKKVWKKYYGFKKTITMLKYLKGDA